MGPTRRTASADYLSAKSRVRCPAAAPGRCRPVRKPARNSSADRRRRSAPFETGMATMPLEARSETTSNLNFSPPFPSDFVNASVPGRPLLTTKRAPSTQRPPGSTALFLVNSAAPTDSGALITPFVGFLKPPNPCSAPSTLRSGCETSHFLNSTPTTPKSNGDLAPTEPNPIGRGDKSPRQPGHPGQCFNGAAPDRPRR